MVPEGRLQLVAALLEEGKLVAREVVEVIAVAAHEVREDRAGDDGTLVLQPLYEPFHIMLGVEAHAPHARVELDVDGEAHHALALRLADKCLEQAETVHLGLQSILEESAEAAHFGVHDHDVRRDARLPEGHALVRYGHCQIIDPVVLQCLGHLHRTRPIGVGLHHAHHAGVGFHEGTIVVEVLDHGTQIHFQNGLVHLLLQSVGDLLEVEGACSLDEHHAVVQCLELLTPCQVVG